METQPNECSHGMGDPSWCSLCTHGWHAGLVAEREAIAREGARIASLVRGEREPARTLVRGAGRMGARGYERTYAPSARDQRQWRPERKRAGVGGPGYVGVARNAISTRV